MLTRFLQTLSGNHLGDDAKLGQGSYIDSNFDSRCAPSAMPCFAKGSMAGAVSLAFALDERDFLSREAVQVIDQPVNLAVHRVDLSLAHDLLCG